MRIWRSGVLINSKKDILLVTLYTFSNISFLYAEDKSPKDFFSKDYSTQSSNKGMLEKKSTPSYKDSEVKKNIYGNTKNPDQDDMEQKFDLLRPEPAQDFSNQGAELRSQLSTATSGVQILAIGAVLKADDEEHLFKHLKELYGVASATNLPLSPVYFVGEAYACLKSQGRIITAPYDASNKAFTAEEVATLAPAIGVVNKLPQFISAVSSSPSWIIETQNGMIILEGTHKSLAEYVNAKGQFTASDIYQSSS
jgi:hypothetical protein